MEFLPQSNRHISVRGFADGNMAYDLVILLRYPGLYDSVLQKVACACGALYGIAVLVIESLENIHASREVRFSSYPDVDHQL